MRVRDLMSRGVVTIDAAESCHVAVERMHRSKVRHLPVVDGDQRLVGVVTDRDLRHYLFRQGVFEDMGAAGVERRLRAVPVSEVMSRTVVSVGPDEPLDQAARHMLDDKVGSLPVVENGRPIGIITETDLLRQLVRADACCPGVEAIVVSYP